ncbi:MAG: transcription antitermination factor NusB [Spirochaetaceae bacterium]|jgi:N utilization substance protein B|nr:transcription antitermination factor NusB [Spirochaetaceae bacterium]
MARRNGRILAFQALFAWETGRNDPALLDTFSWKDSRRRIAEEDLVFGRLLFHGALEHIDEVDEAIRAHLTNWDFNRLNRVDLAILRLSAYTLLYQRDLHPSIVIDEAVDIAKEFSQDDSYKFVNGVLDNIRKDLPGGGP